VIDRLEGEMAVLEVEGTIMWNVPRDFLPPQAREGDVLEFFFTLSEDRSEFDENEQLMKEVFEE